MSSSNKKKKNRRVRLNELKGENSEARARANANLRELEKPRKPVNSSFLANFNSGECPRCFLTIQEGERVRYNGENVLVHVFHRSVEPTFEVCDSCFLTLPCECGD